MRMRSWGRHWGCTRRPGFSLIEMTLGTVITAMVMAAAGGAIHVMTRGSASLQASSQLATDASVAMARLRRELGAAVTISSLTSSAITFTHPDLNGDGADDAVRYEWSGQSGTSLLRQVGSGDPLPVVENVTQFVLTRDTTQVTIPGGASDMTDEVILASHESCPPALSCTFGASPGVTSSSWRGQVFRASINDAEWFTVTRLKIYVQRAGNWGTVYASIRDSGGGNTYDEAGMSVSSIPTGDYVWRELSFSGGATLNPGSYYSFLLRSNTSGSSVYVGRDEYLLSFTSDYAWYTRTDNGGWSYSYDYNRDARFVLYGRFKLYHPQITPAVTRTYLKSLGIRLKLGDGTSTFDLRSGTACVNRPEITGLN